MNLQSGIGTGGEAQGDVISGVENVVGSAFNDTLAGNASANLLTGGDGNDLFVMSAGNDTFDGGNGTDTVDFSASTNTTALTVNMVTGINDGDALGQTFLSIEGIIGTSLNDSLTGGVENNYFSGGAGDDTLLGGAGDDTIVGGAGNDSLDGGTGIDTIDYSASASAVNINLNSAIVSGGDADGDIISNFENVVGTAFADTLTGNSANNVLYGGAGNDVLNGLLGADTMYGGAGNDTYYVDNLGDVVSETGGSGVDLVYSSVSFTLGDGLENLTLTGSIDINGIGNSGDNLLIGNSGSQGFLGARGANVLQGGAGNDTLYGFGGADTLDGGTGNDLMVGGLDNDLYIVDSIGDVIVELTGEGVDTVQSSITYTLSTFLENLTLTGSANLDGTGNAYGNILIGNSGANLLSGLDGNDTIEGGDGNDTLNGGTGNDSMSGGAGDDTYYVDAAGDKVIENGMSGIDTVISSISLTLARNVENLTLLSGALNGTGNTENNFILGNEGANRLEGDSGNDTLSAGAGNDTLDGGDGADSMIGGSGDDYYYVDNVNDQTIELAGGGNDTIESSVSWTLGADFEHLTLTGSTGSSGTGNAQANIITGNTGANYLSGMAGNDILFGGAGADTLDGGTGNDTMYGGAGNDTYLVDSIDDVLVELAGGGNDTVVVGFAYTLSTDFEHLTLTGSAGISGTGNSANNLIIGNSGANLLLALAGNDSLYGGEGNDTLDGGTGTDSMYGGAGDDYYIVDDLGDRITEVAGAGIDTVESSVSFTLSSYLENLILTGSDNINGGGSSVDNVLTGNSGNNLLEGETGNDALYGGLGDDTLDGGAGNDTLYGGAGNDVLNGNRGNDLMVGGLGDDTYIVDSLSDVITELADEGTDTVVAAFNWILGANFENLTLSGSSALTGTGTSGANVITGNGGANKLYGMAGDDTLYGGAGADTLDGGTGNDVMDGGAGNDTYILDSADDIVIELTDGGIDTIIVEADFTVSGEIENIILAGTGNFNAFGSAIANTITGNAGNNILDGGDGNDTLYGGAGNDTLIGGAGVDVLKGGLGSDLYIIDNSADVISETTTGGIDWVESSVNYTLSASVENLTLTGTGNINAIGNSSQNILTGNSGDNLLSGGSNNDVLYGGEGNDTLDGGSGTDTMTGGLGDDTYVVGTLKDQIIELADEGIDTVVSSITLTLAANLENLTLSGVSAINGTGNAANNVLTGNSGKNILNGMAGDDTLIGGGGNDTLTGGTGADHFVFTSLTSGNDTITDFNNLTGGGAQGDVLEFRGVGVGNFVYLGAGAFSGGSDNAEARVVGNKLMIDLNGDGVADFTLTMNGLTNASQLSANDFLFT